jgi:hypothetical protein
MVLAYCGKLWFLDWMVWLCDDMKDAIAEYRISGIIPEK